jgi:hypothetical protein
MATAGRLFDRKYQLKIFKLTDSTSLVIDSLAINFKISKTGRNALMGSDKAQIELINASTETINLLRQPDTFVELKLGYSSGIKRVFIGKIEADGIKVDDNGIDRIIKINASPAGNTFRETFVSLTIPSKTTLPDAIAKFKAAASKISTELASSIKSIEYQEVLDSVILEDGISHTGSFKKALDKLTKMYDVDYYVDGETLYIKQINEALRGKENQGLVLTPSTGLLDKPFLQAKDTASLSNTKSNSQRVEFRALINAELLCGLPVKIESSEVNGWFSIEDISFVGQLRGDDWTAICTGVSIT